MGIEVLNCVGNKLGLRSKLMVKDNLKSVDPKV